MARCCRSGQAIVEFDGIGCLQVTAADLLCLERIVTVCVRSVDGALVVGPEDLPRRPSGLWTSKSSGNFAWPARCARAPVAMLRARLKEAKEAFSASCRVRLLDNDRELGDADELAPEDQVEITAVVTQDALITVHAHISGQGVSSHQVFPQDTIGTLKEALAVAQDCPASDVAVFIGGNTVQQGTLEEIGLKNGSSFLVLMRRPVHNRAASGRRV